MAHKRKTVTDLDQRVIERKKKYVRYQEGAELYSMGVNTFREVARDAKTTVKIKGIVLVNIEIFEEYLELFRAGQSVCALCGKGNHGGYESQRSQCEQVFV